MSKHLPVVSCSEVCGALVKAGFQILAKRGKGSHVFLYRLNPPTGVTVPNEKEVKRGTLRAILRQAGLSVDDFVALL
ncbi:MAG: type II toxin-antitoxin system HicA family toxin [Pirellulaceae bacterium]